MVTTGDPANFNITGVTKRKGARFTSSYEEEIRAMEAAAEILATSTSETDIAVIGTDSQSLCSALLNLNRETDQIRSILSNTKAKIIIQWLPGHSNIPGNEAADAAAKEATTLPNPHQPTSFNSSSALIKQTIRDPTTKHERLAKVYSQFSSKKENEITTRSDQVDLARIRAGHHLDFRAYQHRLDENENPSCPRCEAASHDVEHWIQHCPGTLQARHEIFGEEANDGLSLLTRCPEKSITLARRTLLRGVMLQ